MPRAVGLNAARTDIAGCMPDMSGCQHTTLELLVQRKSTMRCRHCHLTIAGDELGDGYCPECFATWGAKRYEFDKLEFADTVGVRYRCEECGAMIESRSSTPMD